MANIAGFLQNILSARFGKDVRQSIHDAIEAIDKVADSAQDSATVMAQTATEKAEIAINAATSSKESEENSKAYMEAAKTSENNSKTSETNAKTSETNAKASEINAKVSEENAQAVFESLPEDYSTLSNEFYEVAIKQNVSGEDIHVTDSANAKVREFALFGKATQENTSGKNLLENTAVTNTINGITFTVNEDGSVTANGTATDTADFYVNGDWHNENNILPISQGHVISSGTKTDLIRQYIIRKQSVVSLNTIGNNIEFLIDGGIDAVMYRVTKETTLNNLTFYPMIRLASITDDTYEPYTGGQPSPSPEFPQDIEVSGASGSVVVKSCGKNLLKNVMESQTIDGVTFTVNKDDKSVLVNGTPTSNISIGVNYDAKIRLPAGNYILFTGYGKKSNADGYPLFTSTTFYKDGTQLSDHITNSKGVITIDDSVDYISRFRLFIKSGVTVNNVTVYPMLIRAEDSDDYEPYKETTATIPVTDFAGIPVDSGGNYTDSNGQQWIANEIVKYADGSGERVQKVKKKQIISDLSFQTWATKNGTYNRYMSATSDMKKDNNAPILCNVLSQITMTSAYREESILGIFPDGTSSDVNTYIGFINTEWTTLDEFKAFLDANEVYVYYELAEPIHTPLTAEEIAEIEKLQTFYSVTNISNDADCGMSVTYLADSKLYIDNRLAQIEQALIANI